MGSAMALNMARANTGLVVWTRQADKMVPIIEAGGTAADAIAIVRPLLAPVCAQRTALYASCVRKVDQLTSYTDLAMLVLPSADAFTLPTTM